MSTRPNFLVITTDQQHFNAISAAGNEYINTPGLDRLCKRGYRFTNAYTTNPVCGPARSSILTGRMPYETGVYNNGFNIRKGIPNIGQWFRKNGYETVYAGKWHLRKPRTSVIDGFDVIMTGINIQGNVSDTCITSSVEAYLRNYEKEDPFLMMAMYVQPHDICGFVNYFRDEDDLLYDIDEKELPPLPPNFSSEPDDPDKFTLFRDRIPSSKGNWTELKWRYYLWHYYRYVEGVDLEISRLLDVLEDTGLDENTVVVFMSDHGENTANHRTTLKTTLYDESCHVPMIVSPPKLTSGKEVRYPVSVMDTFPTLCGFAGIECPRGITGIDLTPVLEKTSVDRPGVSVESYSGKGRAFINGRYKFIAFNDSDQMQLFDLEKDPFETVNLAYDPGHMGVVSDLRGKMADFFSGLEPAGCLPEDSLWK